LKTTDFGWGGKKRGGNKGKAPRFGNLKKFGSRQSCSREKDTTERESGSPNNERVLRCGPGGKSAGEPGSWRGDGIRSLRAMVGEKWVKTEPRGSACSEGYIEHEQ